MTAMTTRELLKLLDGKQMNQGAAKAKLGRTGRPGHYLPADQKRFLESVSTAARPQRGAGPVHPETEASRNQYRRDKDEDLTPVELAWLQRLPLDPSKVTFDDAVRLAALAASIREAKTPASARLVQSVWEPVKHLHDERVAKDRAERVREPLGKLPKTTVGAIADALMEEHPGVSREALMHEAREIVSNFEAQRIRQYERTIEKADQQLAEVNVDVARSAETAREVSV